MKYSVLFSIFSEYMLRNCEKFFLILSGMCAMIDRIVSSAIPSYDLSIGNGLLFNASDVGEDDGLFMVSRLKLQDAVDDQERMQTVSICSL